MITYIEHGEYRCALLEAGDGEIYKEICLHYIDGEDEKQTLVEEDFFEEHVSSEEQKHFVLLRNENPVGIASAFFKEGQAPYLDGLLIITEYQGQGLSKYLHQTRLKYLAEHTSAPYAEVDVAKKNDRAIRALIRNGFTQMPSEDNDTPLRYQRDLLNFKPLMMLIAPSVQTGLDNTPH